MVVGRIHFLLGFWALGPVSPVAVGQALPPFFPHEPLYRAAHNLMAGFPPATKQVRERGNSRTEVTIFL